MVTENPNAALSAVFTIYRVDGLVCIPKNIYRNIERILADLKNRCPGWPYSYQFHFLTQPMIWNK